MEAKATYPQRLFQCLRRDVVGSTAAPRDQGIRHRSGDGVEDPHIQRLLFLWLGLEMRNLGSSFGG